MSHASPPSVAPSPSVSAWLGLYADGQLSQASPTPSRSTSLWVGLYVDGQLSRPSHLASASASGVPLSTPPVQSLSSPSQTSALGATSLTQASAPLWHVIAPGEQTPACPVTHAPPPPGFPSSICPSQSLSVPSQISALPVP